VVYETFMARQRGFGRPTNPAFLLAPASCSNGRGDAALTVVAFEQGRSLACRSASCSGSSPAIRPPAPAALDPAGTTGRRGETHHIG
jgi:hypothetical protein